MESRGPEDSKNVKIFQAYFFEGFISFFEDFSLTICLCLESLLLRIAISECPRTDSTLLVLWLRGG